MKKAFCFLLTILMAAFCHSQELTKDGFGTLHWGASVADAEKAFPDFAKQSPSYETYKGGWMFQDHIPCDLILSSKVQQDTERLELLFYDGKFLGVSRSYTSQPVPENVVTDSLRNELRQRIIDALGNTDKLDVTISVYKTVMPPPRTPLAAMVNVSVQVQITHKELRRSASEDIQKRLEKFKDGLLTDLPSHALKP